MIKSGGNAYVLFYLHQSSAWWWRLYMLTEKKLVVKGREEEVKVRKEAVSMVKRTLQFSTRMLTNGT